MQPIPVMTVLGGGGKYQSFTTIKASATKATTTAVATYDKSMHCLTDLIPQ